MSLCDLFPRFDACCYCVELKVGGLIVTVTTMIYNIVNFVMTVIIKEKLEEANKGL